jgi:hypothetical protein
MVDGTPGYCPRCGTERMPGMRFCARCGLDLAANPTLTERPPEQPVKRVADERQTRPDPAPVRTALVPMPVIALFAVAGVALFLYFAFFFGRGTGSPSSPTPAGASTGTGGSPSAGISPLPVGLAIVSPADGAVVSTNRIFVIGTAPPGLRVVQDISLGFDRSANVDATGHWALELELAAGDNQMTFRIGDDRSTARTIHVIYQPPPAPS